MAIHGPLKRAFAWVLALVFCRPPFALAQEVIVVPPAASAAPSAPVQRLFSQQELDQILAPIALYPDALLAQLLMASTYPLEVVEAARWVKAHPDTTGDQLQAALQEQTWDPSVKGLTAVPQVLAMMDQKLDWTQKLGDAFLSQQQAVMDTIQSLRTRAQAAGHLASTPEQTVVTQGQQISIVPAAPEVIYVPIYDPALVYGPWWWPAPPYYWYPPGYVVYGPGLYFGFGLFVGAAIWGGCDWPHRTVTVNVQRYNAYTHARVVTSRWTHAPEHRLGVPYRDDATRRQFGRELPGAEFRRDFRGYEPQGQYAGPPRPSVDQIQSRLARPGVQPPGRPPAVERGEPPPAAQRLPAAPSPAPRAPAPSAQPERPAALPRGEPPTPVRRLPAAPPAAERSPPAFEGFGHGEAARAYSNRGAASRGVPHSAPGGGAPRGHR